MLFKKKTLSDIDVKDKRILLRADYNVPMNKDGSIGDDYRIRMSLPTIHALLEQRCSVVILSHLGRPKGKVDESLSLKPIAQRLSELLEMEVAFAENCVGEVADTAVTELEQGQVLLLENTRYHYEEEVDEEGFAKQLAKHGEIFVQDCFGVVHREHASIHAVTKFLPAVAGLLVENEVKQITKATTHPKQPLVAIVGGAKIKTKLGLLENLVPKTTRLLIGGAMANTFLKAKGMNIGKSLFDESELTVAKEIIDLCKKEEVELILPLHDVAVAKAVDASAERREVASDEVADDDIILDIGTQSIASAVENLKGAGTVIWNGPLGMTELPAFRRGSEAVAQAIVDTDAFSIVGGGDTAEFIAELDLMDSFTHVSTGGGSSLELMSGNKLPGVEALLDK